ncbi:hypothetical protein [Salmonella enterica]|uniref:hypothetical protein n=1 Tax=Salmonella enterica TaxID=28901 RepID=UPI000DEC38A0|nr:hypothetical protein [Salmonella enterica]ELJ5777177.1 hypothetical protein [Morganella morganii]AXD45971.1 hypothetical protein CHD70_27985 [Salmonella enterica]EBD9523547.1 hypothetical protein [Salmonella enterica]EDZ2074360.1 hypothetical protein [Salmonella enterica]EDZ4360307.1 hypothetical protein [Salmonella enterica]
MKLNILLGLLFLASAASSGFLLKKNNDLEGRVNSLNKIVMTQKNALQVCLPEKNKDHRPQVNISKENKSVNELMKRN